MQIPRFANATLQTGVVIALSVFGAVIPTATFAAEEDPWFVVAQIEVNEEGIGVSRSPLSTGGEFGPNDRDRVEVQDRVQDGANYDVRLRAFSPYENVHLFTYQYKDGCQTGACWERIFSNAVTVDRYGNADLNFGTDNKRPGTYRYCTTDVRTCSVAWAEFRVTPGSPSTSAVLHHGPDTCINGYVWREAFANDHVCVTPETRTQAAYDNSQAAARRQPGGGPYGPNTCRQGYVWREASASDLVCVTPEVRSQTKYDNSQAASRRVLR